MATDTRFPAGRTWFDESDKVEIAIAGKDKGRL